MSKRKEKIPSSSSTHRSPNRGLTELAVLIGIAVSCIFLIQSISPIIHGTLATANSSNNGDLALAVVELTHTIETMQKKMDTMQDTLNVMSGGNRIQQGDTIAATSTAIQAQPENNKEDLLKELLTKKQGDTGMPQKVLYYNMGKANAGFGSLLNNLLFIGSYARISQGRQLVVDEADQSQYRKDYNHGMISGYFDTAFPVVTTGCQRELIRQHTGVDFLKLPKYDSESGDSHRQIIQVQSHDGDTFNRARAEARHFYTYPTVEKGPGKIHQFYTLSTEYCHNVKINQPTLQAIHSMLEKASIPDFSTLPGKPITVAMHVRRGDKVKEVNHTPSQAYVQKLEQVLRENNMTTPEQLSRLQHCFIATDDYAAFLEIQREMSNSPMVSNCKLHTLAAPANHQRDSNDFNTLLAEMKMMVDATYFIGTWSSNIGVTVTFFRGCNHPALKGNGLPPVRQEYNILTEAQVANRLDHYYHSYGIEGDEWFMFRE